MPRSSAAGKFTTICLAIILSGSSVQSGTKMQSPICNPNPHFLGRALKARLQEELRNLKDPLLRSRLFSPYVPSGGPPSRTVMLRVENRVLKKKQNVNRNFGGNFGKR